jgi:hypothetical protein
MTPRLPPTPRSLRARSPVTAALAALQAQSDAANSPWFLTGGGEMVFPRFANDVNNGSLPTGQMRLGFFTAKRSEAITQVRVYSGGTAATSVTLGRVGVFSVAGNGDLTLIHSTTSDTALFTATSTAYTKALNSTFNKVIGTRYAVGVLLVCSGSGSILGSAGNASGELAVSPRMNGLVTGQSDLPSSVAAGSITNTSYLPQAHLVA